MNVRNILRSESVWTSAVIILAAMMVFMRSASHILIGDELRYCYKFELKPGQNYFNFNNLKPVKTVSDVIDSQINHYECVNGRIPVHFAEQIIAATKGIRVFYVINAIAFAAMLLLFIRVTLPRRLQWWNPLAALIAAIALLYLFPAPGRLWMSVNLSLNYMWPALASLSVIYCLRKITATGWKPSATANAGLITLGFLTGWSNEAFAFPLSAATFLYFALNIRQFDRRARMIVIPLWTGALIMLLSPGNWIRA
ncbi:MAG: hypothetical protein K2O12_00420, partial [Muribaculaceae bacterium]|nr:hypothetical protein [Muribaculaceae bacterium]